MTCDGYLYWHWLHIYSCAICLLPVFMLLSYVLLFSYLFCYLACSCSYCYLCTISLHEIFPPLHTHSPWSRSDDPGFARPDIGRLVSFVQVFVEAVCFANSWSFFLFYSGTLIFFSFHIISWFLSYQLSSYSSHYSRSWFILYHAWLLICIVAVTDDYFSSDL